jgi:hypothetical protein
MFASWSQFASTDPKAGLPLALLWTIVVFTGVVLTAGVVFIFLGRWVKRSPTEMRSSGDQLTQFRLLYERGEFSQEEYDRIRTRITQKLRKDLTVPVEKAPAPAADAPAATAALPATDSAPTIARTEGAPVAPTPPTDERGSGDSGGPDTSIKPA